MPASREQISQWLDRAYADEEVTHLIVKCDTYDFHGDHDDDCCYPVYVKRGEEARAREVSNPDRTMEVYSKRRGKEEQLNAPERVFNYD